MKMRIQQQHTARLALSICLLAGCGRQPESLSEGFTGAALTTKSVEESIGPITVEARGKEFKWRFLTIGPDGKIGSGDEVELGNDLVVPAQQLITLILTSEDYVYTLNVPDGRIAAAVPDMVHQIQFKSPGGGRHEFRTDPMCGLRYFHDDVLGTMSVAQAAEGFSGHQGR